MISMKLGELPAGTRVAVDANIVLYHFTGRSSECSRFLQRARDGDLTALMPTHIGLELLHRLMMLEAVAVGIIKSGSPAKKMSAKPDSVRKLQRSYRDFQALGKLGIKLVDTPVAALERVTWFSMNYGLLANDAALLAVMEHEGVEHLVSSDKLLQDIAPFQTWRPQDL